MKKTNSQTGRYLISALLGAVGGGLLVMVATRALPTMLANFMAGMMRNMMSHMETGGWNPKEMCQQMMAHFAEASKE